MVVFFFLFCWTLYLWTFFGQMMLAHHFVVKRVELGFIVFHLVSYGRIHAVETSSVLNKILETVAWVR